MLEGIGGWLKDVSSGVVVGLILLKLGSVRWKQIKKWVRASSRFRMRAIKIACLALAVILIAIVCTLLLSRVLVPLSYKSYKITIEPRLLPEYKSQQAPASTETIPDSTVPIAPTSPEKSIVPLPEIESEAYQISWRTDTSQNMNERREYVAVCALNGDIYAIGGQNEKGILSSAEVLKPNGKWRRISPLNTERNAAGAVGINGKLYLVGGGNSRGHVAAVACYRPIGDAWEDLPDIPTTRTSPAVTSIGTTIFVIGGIGEKDPAGAPIAVEAFDTVTKTWWRCPNIGRMRYGGAAVTMAGKIYVLGGEPPSSEIEPTIEVYDPATREWSSFESKVLLGNGIAAVAYAGRILIFGGSEKKRDVLLFQPELHGWARATRLTRPRNQMGACVVRNRIYVVGGEPLSDVVRMNVSLEVGEALFK